MKRHPDYKKAAQLEKGSERNRLFKHLKEEYGVTKYALNRYVQPMEQKFKQNIGSQMAQNIAERAFSAVEKVMYGQAKKVRFCQRGEFHSLEEKTNQTGFRYFPDRQQMKWLGLTLPVILKDSDEYAHLALQDRLKYCRLLKKVICGKNRYFVQFALEGFPPKKRNQRHSKDPKKRVGIDIGTSTIVVVSDKKVQLTELAEGIATEERKRRNLQRKLDRQRRANNPNKFNEDGTGKSFNRNRWVISKNYLKTKYQLAEISRKLAEKRKQKHQQYANDILSLGLDVRVETMNYKGLQARVKKTEISEKTGRYKRKKRFGKSIANRAPALFLTILDNKLKAKGLTLKKIDTAKVKASQFNHFNQTYVKKSLGTSWNPFEQGDIHRDLYSAFLIMNTKDNLKKVDIKRATATWPSFFKAPEEETRRIRGLNKKQLSSIGL